MGVKGLNKFIDSKSSDAVSVVSLEEYRNKKIAIDINNYIYRYKGNHSLIESIFSMCSVLHKYEIIPIFVFDNRTKFADKTNKKYIELKKRAKDKVEGEKTCIKLEEKLEEIKKDETIPNVEVQKLESKIKQLKRDIVRVTKDELISVKEVINSYKMIYYDAPNEADNVCAFMCKNGIADACLSEDSDMFIYGCPVILKHFSLMYETVKRYDYKKILENLDLCEERFRKMCILSGTDYNTNKKYDSNTVFDYYKKHVSMKKVGRDYIMYKFKLDRTLDDFDERVELNEIYSNYSMNECIGFEDIYEFDFNRYDYDIGTIRRILEKHDFYFV